MVYGLPVVAYKICCSFTQGILLYFYAENSITLVVISVAAIDEVKRLETQRHALLFVVDFYFKQESKRNLLKIYNSGIT